MKKNLENYLTFILVLNLIVGCEKEKVPVLSTNPISNLTSTSATCGGIVTDEGSSTVIARGICWSTNSTPTISETKSTDGAGAGSFTSGITGLNGGSTYYVRAYATNSIGTGYGMAMSFTTLGKTPLAISGVPTNLTGKVATLNGTVNANHLSTIVTFEYGTSSSYGNSIIANQSPISGNENTNVSASISNLTAATVYHFRIKAENTLGTTYSDDISFTTLGQAPTASTLAATKITTTSAQLNGYVNTNYLSTTVSFEYGISTNYENTISSVQSPLTGGSIMEVNVSISGLTIGTTYHYRVKASNSLGTTYGSDMAFTPNYAIGETHAGGIIFYIDVTGQHGLVCAPIDQGTSAIWNCNISGATSYDAGYENTMDIVNGCSTVGTAARICYDLVLNGYDDWYLPSKNQLEKMYIKLKRDGTSNLGSGYYWSSTRDATLGVWTQYFTNGYQNFYPTGNDFAVRAIRNF